MKNYSNHSKFVYTNKDTIQDGIANGTVDINDILYIKDTHENVLITENYEIVPVQCRVYRFNDVESAETILNQRTDTYAGQVIAILGSRGNYSAYMVNKRNTGKYGVDPIDTSDPNSIINYDSLGNRPIVNLKGEQFEPIVLDEQRDGIYKVDGTFKISQYVETTFVGGTSYLFLVEHQDNGITMIKRVSANGILDYIINSNDKTVTTSVVPTTDWLKQQGYVTEGYVYDLLTTMGIITKSEIEEYVADVINNNVTVLVQNIVSQEFDERFVAATEREVLDVFVDAFK